MLRLFENPHSAHATDRLFELGLQTEESEGFSQRLDVTFSGYEVDCDAGSDWPAFLPQVAYLSPVYCDPFAWRSRRGWQAASVASVSVT